MVPSSEACLYGHINWSLAQAQQQSLIGLSQSFLSKRDGKARPWTGFHFTVQKSLCQGVVVPLWLRGLPWRVGMRLIQVAGAGGSVSSSSADARKKGGCWGWHS